MPKHNTADSDAILKYLLFFGLGTLFVFVPLLLFFRSSCFFFVLFVILFLFLLCRRFFSSIVLENERIVNMQPYWLVLWIRYLYISALTNLFLYIGDTMQ